MWCNRTCAISCEEFQSLLSCFDYSYFPTDPIHHRPADPKLLRDMNARHTLCPELPDQPSVDLTFPAKFDSLRLGFQSAFVGTFQDAETFGFGHGSEYRHQHLAHRGRLRKRNLKYVSAPGARQGVKGESPI